MLDLSPPVSSIHKPLGDTRGTEEVDAATIVRDVSLQDEPVLSSRATEDGDYDGSSKDSAAFPRTLLV